MHVDPATLRRAGCTVTRMRPHADRPEQPVYRDPAPCCSRPPAGYVCSLTEGHTGPCPAWPAATVTDGLPPVHVAVTAVCALRPGQEFPDVHAGTGHARTYLAALALATEAATRVPIAEGRWFRLTTPQRR